MNDNNIDKLFKNNLEGIEYTPSERVWKDIENKVVYKPFYVLYKKQLTIAALLLLLITAGYFVFDFYGNKNSKPEQQKMVNVPVTIDNETEENMVVNDDNKSGFSSNKNNVKADMNNSGNTVSSVKENSIAVNNTDIAQEEIRENGAVDTKENINLSKTTVEIHKMQGINIKGLILGYDYNLHDYQPTFEDVLMPYLEKRNNIHVWTGISASASMVYYPDSRDMASYSTGVDAGIKLGKFYVASGGAYNITNEEGRYKIDFQSYDSVGFYNKVISFEINPQNPEQITYKTVKATVYDSVVHVNIVNPQFKHKYLSIPLRAGYRFFDNERFSASVETGVVFSKLLSSDIPLVEFNNPDFKVLSIARETPYRKNINWQWTLGLNLGYKIKKGMSVTVSPVFSKYITNIYNSGDKVLPYSMGIRFGIYYDF